MGSAVAATTASSEDDDWELCNEDGFVFKRQKKRRIDDGDPAAVETSVDAPPPESEAYDPVVEENQRRERKRRKLLELKVTYQREIDQWENLSNTLRDMEVRTSQLQEQRRREREQDETASVSESFPLPVIQTDDFAKSKVDELLFQVEAQEAMIRNASDLCDIAEALCSEQDGKLKQTLIDLPIWASPRELMALLCDE